MTHYDEPLISVALCTYNGACYLREQMDSLLAQRYRNLEIVAVDDASQDETPALLQEYARREPRLRLVLNQENLGFRRNFRYAMSLCTGEFIAPCDQDDLWHPGKLRILLQAMGPWDMAYCDSELIAADGASLGMRMSDRWKMQNLADPAALVLANCVSGHAMLFRRGLLQDAPPVPQEFFHDWWLTALAASRSGVVYCPQVLVRYRQHERNVTDILRVRDERASRPVGYGWKNFQDVTGRLSALAALHDAHHDFLTVWHRLWVRHARAWFSPTLAAFMVVHRQRIYALSRNSAQTQVRKAAGHVFGMRLRAWQKRKKYEYPQP